MYQLGAADAQPWALDVAYPEQAVVSYRGQLYESNVPHTSYPGGGTPSDAPHLWKHLGPLARDPQGSQGDQVGAMAAAEGAGGPAVAQPFATNNTTYAPSYDPPPYPPPDYGRTEGAQSGQRGMYDPSTSGDKSKGILPDPNQVFNARWAERAAEPMRYATVLKESHDEHDKDELEDELEGKRVWRTGGVGIWAYSADKHDEDKKRQVWTRWTGKHGEQGKQAWLTAARARTNFYNEPSHGVKPLIRWKLVERGGPLPDDALPIGHESNGTFLYAARAWWQGGLHPGKAGRHLINSASISWGGSEHTLDIYEVLCGYSDDSVLQWRDYSHGERAFVDGWQPVEGGREEDGTPLMIAKGEYESGVHPGKCLLNDDHACIGWGNGEVWVRPFQVLAYCSPTRR